MGKTRSAILTLGLALILSTTTYAEITIFDSNSTISGGSYDTVVIKGDGTVVDMTGGDVNSIVTMNASTFNISGGSVNSSIRSYGASSLNLTGGILSLIYSFGQGHVTISGNADTSSSYCHFYHSTVVTISSYNVTLPTLHFHDSSTLQLLAGSIYTTNFYGSNILQMTGGNISFLRTDFKATPKLNISGGTINQLIIRTYGTAWLSGGTIGGIDVQLTNYDNILPTIEIIGYDLISVPYGGIQGLGQITGYWNNDASFSIDLDSGGTYAYLSLYDGVIPPICANKPESDLSGDCKVNFVDFSKMAGEWLECGLDPNEACWE